MAIIDFSDLPDKKKENDVKENDVIDFSDLPQKKSQLSTIDLSTLPDKSFRIEFSDLPDKGGVIRQPQSTDLPEPGPFGRGPDVFFDIQKQLGIGFINEAALGMPLYAVEKISGKKARESLTSPYGIGKIARGVGTAAGFAVGLPQHVMKKGAQLLTESVKATRNVSKMGRFATAATEGAGAFGALEALSAPRKDFQEKTSTVPIALAGGAALGLAGEALKPFIEKAITGIAKRFQKPIEVPSKIMPTSESIPPHETGKGAEVQAALKEFRETRKGKWVPRIMRKKGSISSIPNENGVKDVVETTVRVRTRHIANNGFVTSERVYLEGQGKSARNLVRSLDRIDTAREIGSGNFSADYLKVREGMTKQELVNFYDAAEGRALPMNEKVTNLLSLWKNQSDYFVKNAQGLNLNIKSYKTISGESIPEITLFKPRNNYFPHYIIPIDSSTKVVNETLEAAVKRGQFKNMTEALETWESYKLYVSSGKRSEKILDYIVKSGRVKTKEEALNILNKFIRRVSQRRYGNLELSRDINLPFYDINPDRVLPRYYDGATGRLVEVKEFGLNDEKAKQFLDGIMAEGGDQANAREAWERWAGIEPQKNAFSAIDSKTAQGIRSFQTVTKLGLSAIPNATQSINTAYVTGVKNTAMGIQDAFTKEGREFALRTGAVLESTINDIMAVTTGKSGLGHKFLKRTGFLFTEKMNRLIAANAGRHYALEISSKFLANPQSKYLRRALTQIDLNPDLIWKRGNITLEEVMIAARKVVNKTQFRSGVLDLPLFFSSPEGRLITQFKNFAFNQTKLMKDAILIEAARGNFRPLITATTLMPILGEVVADVRSLLTGRTRKQGIERLAENMAAVGGFGIISDLYQAASIRKFGGAIGGPTFADIADLGESTLQLLSGKPTPMARFISRKVPVTGTFIANVFFSSARQKQKTNNSAYRGLRSLRKLNTLRKIE